MTCNFQRSVAAGVTEMTFFRDSSAKQHLLLNDRYDPVLITAIVGRLVVDGASPDVARVAAASVLAALVTGMYLWAESEDCTLADAIKHALGVIECTNG